MPLSGIARSCSLIRLIESRPDRSAGVNLHREHGGEPAHGAGQVDVVEQVFAAMAFQLDQGRWLAGPAPNHPRQRRQQQVVDLRAIGRRRFLQQLPGQVAVEHGFHADGVFGWRRLPCGLSAGRSTGTSLGIGAASKPASACQRRDCWRMRLQMRRPGLDRRWSWPAGAAACADAPARRRFADLRAASATTRRPPPGDASPAAGADCRRPCPPARRAATDRLADSGCAGRALPVLQAAASAFAACAATAVRRCSSARRWCLLPHAIDLMKRRRNAS